MGEKREKLHCFELHFSTHSHYAHHMVKIMNNSDIPFETEAELRVRGTAKTPDILLSCPVGIRVRKRNEVLSPSSMMLPSMVARNEEVIEATNMSPPNPKSKMTTATDKNDKSYDDTDDELYEWKIICWIDSKVRRISGEYCLVSIPLVAFDQRRLVYMHTIGFIWRCGYAHQQRIATSRNIRPSVWSRTCLVLVWSCPIVSTG